MALEESILSALVIGRQKKLADNGDFYYKHVHARFNSFNINARQAYVGM
ncbi:MAG: hypothetical protein ABW189_03495 [Rickettsiales bacterium]